MIRPTLHGAVGSPPAGSNLKGTLDGQRLCSEPTLPIVKPIADRDYRLRDFTVISPDGVGLRSLRG
jgi:hypothetical protein